MKSCSEMNEQISMYIDNELSADERREFEEHIDSCADCKREFEEIAYIAGICRDIEDEELPENFREELHQKLLHVKEQDTGKSKIVTLRVRYARIFSSVAAGLLLIFLVRGLFVSGTFSFLSPSKSSTSADSEASEMQAAAAPAPAAAKAPAADAANSGMSIQSTLDKQGNQSLTQVEPKPEVDRSANTQNRTSAASSFTTAASLETVSDRVTTITILVDDPKAQVDTIKSIAVQNGGEEQQKVQSNTDAKMAVTAADAGTEIRLNFMIPNIQYDAFNSALASNYGQANIEPGALVSEDLIAALNGLITQSGSLDTEIKKLEDTKDAAKQAELDKLNAEKEKVEKDIESIRLGSDFTQVSVIIKKK